MQILAACGFLSFGKLNRVSENHSQGGNYQILTSFQNSFAAA